jgi:hypothetical protein
VSLTAADGRPACRFCSAPLELSVVDLGMSPLCESFLRVDQIRQMEPFYPLHVFVCERWHLVQIEAFVPRDKTFTEYAYLLGPLGEHARRYVEMMRRRLGLGPLRLRCRAGLERWLPSPALPRPGIPILGIDPCCEKRTADS